MYLVQETPWKKLHNFHFLIYGAFPILVPYTTFFFFLPCDDVQSVNFQKL